MWGEIDIENINLANGQSIHMYFLIIIIYHYHDDDDDDDNDNYDYSTDIRSFLSMCIQEGLLHF